MRLRMLCAALALIVGQGVAGCTSGPASDGGFVSGDGSVTRIAPAQRSAAPVVSGRTLDGGSWSSEQNKGRILVYNVWGSWCGPCRKEAPALQAASTQLGSRAIFIGLNTRDSDPATASAFVRAFQVTYPSIFDPDARLLLGFSGQLPTSAVPSTLIVDREGRVAARILGEATTATVVGLVEDIGAGQ